LPEAINSLSYAIRPGTVIKHLGQMFIMVAMLTLVPLVVSIGFGEYHLTSRYLIIVLLLFLAGFFSSRIEHVGDLQINEALTITALTFVITPLLMSYPLMGSGLTFIDAWFEATSAVTTTGLSTLTDLEAMPKTFLFTRAWMQWYGGLGIIILWVALLMGHHQEIKRLVGTASDNIMTTTRHYARRMLIIYSVLTLVGIVLLWLVLKDLFLAITYCLAAVSTGGFSPLNHSLVDIPAWTGRYVIILLGFFSALPLVLYYRMIRENRLAVWRDPEARLLVAMTLFISALLWWTIHTDLDLSWADALGHAVLLGISAQSTTGFTSLEISHLGSDAMVVLIIAMITGGGAGSTAGGIKLLRLIIMARLIQFMLQRSAMPSHAVSEPRIGDRQLVSDEIKHALLLVILFMMVVVVSWFIFLRFDYPPMATLFEVTSATGTVGLSSGITSSDLEPALKMTLGIDMLLGRLEIIALLILLYPPTWIGKRKE